MIDRYSRNIGAISEEEQELLFTKTVLVVGLGGLGGYTSEYLARVGVGSLRLCDCDAFDESNLNRQINATEASIGKRKVEAAIERVKSINGGIDVKGFDMRFTAETAGEMLEGADLVIDALDNVSSRFVLEEEASKAGVPLIFGAISGWDGQVSTILPGRPILKKIYKSTDKNVFPVLPFTPAAVSAYQVSEAVKVLLGRGELAGKLLVVDLAFYENSVFPV